jgi:hypothetical protein
MSLKRFREYVRQWRLRRMHSVRRGLLSQLRSIEHRIDTLEAPEVEREAALHARRMHVLSDLERRPREIAP